MTSLTHRLKMKEKRKKTREGKPRKRALAAGTTPRFPVHIEEAPDAVLPMPPGSSPKEK